MHKTFLKALLGAALMTATVTSCKKWDDHNAITDPAVGMDLFQQVSANSNLSKFAELLTKSGYDKVIASSKTFTVFAPTNAALATLDAATINDSAKLRRFVANHITNQTYNTALLTTAMRIQMLNGKYVNLVGKKFDEATITEADRYTKNGMLQVIDKMVPALDNAWDFVAANPAMPAKMGAFLRNLTFKVFDATNAVQIGVDPVTGAPVYQPGTDSIITNGFWRNVYDVRNEAKEYTLFVLADAAWDAETNRLLPYYASPVSPVLSAYYANLNMINEYAVEGAYTAAALPDTIVSRYNVKLGIAKSAIVQSIKTSNGYIHILNNVAVRPKDKFKEIIIQAENYNTTSADRRGNTYFRDRFNPVTTKDFRDVLVYNHGLATFNLGYRISNVPAGVKYRAYWVAVHDNINGITGTFTQKLGIDTATSVKFFGYTTVAVNNYNEVLIGECQFPDYRPSMQVFLTAANSTTATANPIVCDYIRFEPVL